MTITLATAEAQPGVSLPAVEGPEVVSAEVGETVNTNTSFPICGQQFWKDPNHCWREQQDNATNRKGPRRALGLLCGLSLWWDIHSFVCLFFFSLKAELESYFPTSCSVPGSRSCPHCASPVPAARVVNISRTADCPGWCPATGAGGPPGWNPARTDAGAGIGLPIISGRAVSCRCDAPAPQAGPSCLWDVEQGSGRPGRLLRGEAKRDFSGAENWETSGWDYSRCVDGVRRRSQQSPGLAGLWQCS